MSFFAVLLALVIEQFKPLPRDNWVHHLLVSWVGWTGRNFDAGGSLTDAVHSRQSTIASLGRMPKRSTTRCGASFTARHPTRPSRQDWLASSTSSRSAAPGCSTWRSGCTDLAASRAGWGQPTSIRFTRCTIHGWGGQAIDLAAVGKTLTVPELEFMHIHKTGALIRAAAVLGARCGSGLSEAEFARVDAYAKAVGLAFQVVDDVLDAEAPTATLGKTAGKDAEQGKPTYVSAMGIPQAKALAAQLREEALAAIAPFGARGARLAQLADFIVLRKF